MKLCSTCKKSKLATEFYHDKRTPDGLKSPCKKCHTLGNIRTRNKDRKRDANSQCMAKARAATPHKFRERERIASVKRVKDERTIARQMLNDAIRSGKFRTWVWVIEFKRIEP